jgi:enoyl-CoA hydratase
MPVTLEVRGQVAILTINRPEARNAVNAQVAEEMEARLDEFEANADLWVVLSRARAPASVQVRI